MNGVVLQAFLRDLGRLCDCLGPKPVRDPSPNNPGNKMFLSILTLDFHAAILYFIVARA